MSEKDEKTLEYAGFLKRATAFAADYLIVGVASLLLKMGINHFFEDIPGVPLHIALLFIGGWAYWSFQESSRLQATFGKQLVNVIVTDLNGDQLSFTRASIRYLTKVIGLYCLTFGLTPVGLTPLGGVITELIATVLGVGFCIGFILVIFTPKKQALHDMITMAVVVKT